MAVITYSEPRFDAADTFGSILQKLSSLSSGWVATLLMEADPNGVNAMLSWSVVGSQEVDSIIVQRKLGVFDDWADVATLAGTALEYTHVDGLDGLGADVVAVYRVVGMKPGFPPSASTEAAALPNQGQYKLLAWYNAQDVENGSVSTLPDRRWQSKDLAQADTDLQPMAADTGPNGRRVLQFSGSGDGLLASRQFLLNESFYAAEDDNFPQSLTVMVIFRRTGTMPGSGDNALDKYLVHLWGDFVDVSAGTVSSGRALLINTIGTTDPAQNLLTWSSWPPGEFDLGIVTTPTYDLDWHVAVATESAQAGSAPRLYLDGVEQGFESLPLAKTILELRLGAGTNAGDGFWGDFLEVAIYKDLTSPAALQRYAEVEYGL